MSIHKFIRRYLTKKRLIKLKDHMTHSLLFECIETYNKTIRREKKINNFLKCKKIRHSNFPSHISENLVKFAFFKKYNMMPSWDMKPGDLMINNLKLEVKGSLDLNNGPISFGPNENWNFIYFLDGYDTLNLNYKVYEIKHKNKSELWKSLKINKDETYENQCIQKRRPRINFNKIQEHFKDECKLIFNGNFKDLNNNFKTD